MIRCFSSSRVTTSVSVSTKLYRCPTTFIAAIWVSEKWKCMDRLIGTTGVFLTGGTKWDAYEASFNESDNTLWFDTAWSCPIPVLNKLAEICCINGIEFEGEWADEDCGCNVGVFWSDNHINEDYVFCYTPVDDETNKAYDIYVKLKGESECLGKDDDGHWIRYDCDTCPNKDKC